MSHGTGRRLAALTAVFVGLIGMFSSLTFLVQHRVGAVVAALLGGALVAGAGLLMLSRAAGAGEDAH